MSTTICIVGTIATVPRFTQTASGAAFCSFRVASNERRYDREQGQWVDRDTNWFTVNAFRGLAEHASESFSKGDRVVASGRVRVRQWESKEKSGTAVEIEAEALGHDLRWGVSRFTKRFSADAAATGSTSAAASVPSTDPGEAGSTRDTGEQSAWLTTPESASPNAGQDGSNAPAEQGDGLLPVAA